MTRILPTIITLFFLTSCGFQPMYGKDMKAVKNLQNIKIANIPDRSGQILKNDLIDRIYDSTSPKSTKYLLELSRIHETSTDMDITIRSDTTRKQITLTTNMRLINKDTQEVMVEKKLKASGSYNILPNEYAVRSARNDLRRDLIKKLAQKIERALLLSNYDE